MQVVCVEMSLGFIFTQTEYPRSLKHELIFECVH